YPRDASQTRREMPPTASSAKVAAEIVEDDEAALQQVRAERGSLFVVHRPEARLGHVRDWVLAQVRVVEGQNVALLDVRIEVADLVEDFRQVPLGIGIAVRPRGKTPVVVAAWPSRVFQPR